MKKRISLLLGLLALVVTAGAATYPLAELANTEFKTNTIAFTATNTTQHATNTCDWGTYHTLQTVVVSTNDSTVTYARSLDGYNFKSVVTNSVAAGTNLVEATWTGRWRYYKVSVFGTNVSNSLTYYLGGR